MNEKWKKLVEDAFEAAGLPEVSEDQLEAGAYTNAQMIEKMKGKIFRLVDILLNVDSNYSPAYKRSVVSFTINLILMN